MSADNPTTFTEFFQFKQDPFKRTPDVEFYYETDQHKEALDMLNYLVKSDEPFAVLIGEPGTGKTITLKKFISELPKNVVFAYILFPNLSPEELFQAILEDLDVKVKKGMSKNALFSSLRDFLLEMTGKDKTVVIIIDEAQNLPNETIEELRILSNLETEKNKLLKIILAGQPELESKLQDESLRQLRQRVTLSAKLNNIGEDDIPDYINSHLYKAGKSAIKVQSGVIRKISQITKGNPRLINTLMERTILASFLDNSHTVTENHLVSAISSLNTALIPPKKPLSKKLIVSVASVILVIFAAIIVYQSLLNGKLKDMVASNNAANSSMQTTAPAPEPAPTPSPAPAPAPEPTPAPTPTTEPQKPVNILGARTEQPTPTLPAPAPAVTTPALKPAPAPIVLKKKVEVLTDNLNIRAYPSTNGIKLAATNTGDIYEYVSEKAEWVEIKLPSGRTGWVYKKFVSISQVIEQ